MQEMETFDITASFLDGSEEDRVRIFAEFISN